MTYDAFADATKKAPDMTQNPNASSHCYFLLVPRELRDMVYDYLFTADLPILLYGNTWTTDEGSNKVPGGGLLRTCKQINAEVDHLLYRKTTFLLSFDFQQSSADVCTWDNVTLQTAHTEKLMFRHDNLYHIMGKPKPARYFPVTKIRNLELRLKGPNFVMHSTKPRTEEEIDAHCLAGNIALYLPSCIDRCEALEELRIVCSGWSQAFGWVWLNQFIARKLRDVVCRGNIEWVQESSEEAKTWIGEYTRATLEEWTTKKVTYVRESEESAWNVH